MMESAGAAEPSSENDSIHSFTLKEWFENLCHRHDDSWMPANSKRILTVSQLPHVLRSSPRSQLEGKYYFRSLLVPTIIS